jgi:hypothetical protein
VTSWPSTRAQRVLAALLRIGWSLKRQSGSHRPAGFQDYVFAFTRARNSVHAFSRVSRSIRDCFPRTCRVSEGAELPWKSELRRTSDGNAGGSPLICVLSG